MSELKQILTNISEEKNTKIIPDNIKKGITIFNVAGSFEGPVSLEEYNRVVEEKNRYYSLWQEALKELSTSQNNVSQLIAELNEVQTKIKEINGEGVPK